MLLWKSPSVLPPLCLIRFGLLRVHFHLFPETFWFRLWFYWFAIHYLISCYKFQHFCVFSLRLFSSFKPLWSKKIFDMISIFLNFLRIVLFPIMWSIFENVQYAFEKNVYFVSLGWMDIYIYLLNPFDLGNCSMHRYPCWYFVWNIYTFFKVRC